MRYILASASPRRSQLLGQLTDDFRVVRSDYDEQDSSSNAAIDYALFNAKAKALACPVNVFGEVIIAADTVVEIGGEILGKPKNDESARAMLKKLSGKKHSVITAVCFCHGRNLLVDYEQTFVTFGELTDAEIDEYIKSGSPRDKAGSYGIQDEFIKSRVKKVEGNVDNVIGLPLRLIKKMDAIFRQILEA